MEKMKLVVYTKSFFILILSVFLTTFESTVVPDVESTAFTGPPLAHRVVLIVIDGLAMHLVREKENNLLPFITNMSRNFGSFGLVRAAVPTESRPRHIALLSGFEEDPACIKTRWRRNIAPFDAVLHQTEHSWAWGDSEIIQPFHEAFPSASSRVSYDYFPTDARTNFRFADTFVFERFLEFTKANISQFSKKTHIDLNQENSRRGKLLFMHLCSVDDIGHHGGHGNPYYAHIVRKADETVAQIYNLLTSALTPEEHESTAFLVTGDHGSKHDGGHGGGSSMEIFVPIFFWGAGLKKGANADAEVELSPVNGFPVITDQINICTLIAALLATVIPSNAHGSLPIHLLNATDTVKAKLATSNIQHLNNLLYALKKKANRDTILPQPVIKPVLYLNGANDLNFLHDLQKKIQNSFQSPRWYAWRVSFVIWCVTILLILMNVILDVMQDEWTICVSNSGYNPHHRSIIMLFSACSLLTVLLRGGFQVATFQEMLSLPLLCITIMTYLDGRFSIILQFLRKPACSLSRSTEEINISLSYSAYCRISLLILQTYLSVQGFNKKWFYSLAILLLVVSKITNGCISTNFKVFVLWTLVSIIIAIGNVTIVMMDDLISLRGMQILGLSFLVMNQTFYFLFQKQSNRRKLTVDTILENISTLNYHLLCLNIYIFQTDIFSLLLALSGQNWMFTSTVGAGLFLVFLTYCLIVCRRTGDSQKLQTILWIGHHPILLLIGASNLLVTGTWAEMGHSLAYFLYLSFIPPILAFTFFIC